MNNGFYNFRSLVDDDKEIVCQESLMNAILTEVHYLPDSWVGKAHTQQVSNQFSFLKPYLYLIFSWFYQYNYESKSFL